MHEAMTMTTVLFATMLIVAMITDVRSSRIPNRLTLIGVVIALVLRLTGGVDPFVQGVLGVAVALAVTMPLVALGGLGAGDSKLLAAVGAFMGPLGFMHALLAAAVVGGILGVVVSAKRGVILPVLLGSKALLVRMVTLGRHGERVTLDTPGAVTIPYAIPIAVGSMMAWVL